MRDKNISIVITFYSTTDAMYFENLAQKSDLNGRLIPIPSFIKAGCGLCWKEDTKNRNILENLIKIHNIKYEQIIETLI